MTESSLKNAPLYERIYAVVAQIPPGQVASYGHVAAIVGRCPPRRVGYALSALGSREDVPWQRVINKQGTISARKDGSADSRQRQLLTAEGVVFDAQGRVDFARAGWLGPEPDWLTEHGFEPAPPPDYGDAR